MTDEEIGYRRINGGVFKFHEYTKFVDGVFKWNPYFVEHIQEHTLMFKEMFQDRIIGEIGDTGWAIYFTQYVPEQVSYFVDIYVDNPEHFEKIVGVIRRYVHKDFLFTYQLRGNVAAYIGNQ